MFEKVLVAHDGADGAQKAFDAAVDLASELGASLHMVSGTSHNLARMASCSVLVVK